MKAQRFHELPLVIFTTLAILGAGMLAVPLVAIATAAVDTLGDPSAQWREASASWNLWREASASRNLWREASASRSLLGVALLFAGLAVSMAHLGKPARSPLAAARLGRSRLSLEIALVGATLAAGAAATVWPALSSLTLVAALCAAAMLLVLGVVYALPGQLAWLGAAAVTPLTMGLAFGTLVLQATSAGGAGRIQPAVLTLLAADALAFTFRWMRVSKAAGTPPRSVRGTAGPNAHLLLAARFVLVDVVPCVLLLAGLPRGAAGMLGLGVLVDRLGFYLLAVQHTTEREIDRIESIIDSGDGDDTRSPGAGRAPGFVLLLAFAAAAWVIVPTSLGDNRVYVAQGEMDAAQQVFLIGGGIDRLERKPLSFYNTAILYPDRNQLRSTEPFLGYVLLGWPLRRALPLTDADVFELLRWAIVFTSLAYAYLLFRALGVGTPLAAAGALLCVSQPGLLVGIERLQFVAIPLVLAMVYHAVQVARAGPGAGRWHALGLFATSAVYPLLGAVNAVILAAAAVLIVPFLLASLPALEPRRRVGALLVPLLLAFAADAALLAPWALDRADLKAYTVEAFLRIKHWGETAVPLRLRHVPQFLEVRLGGALLAAIALLTALAHERRARGGQSRGQDVEVGRAPSSTYLLAPLLPAALALAAAAFGWNKGWMPWLRLLFDASCFLTLALFFRGQLQPRRPEEDPRGTAAFLAAGLAAFLVLLSFGPAYASNVHPLQSRLAGLLMRLLPPLASIRDWERFWLFGMVSLAVAVTAALDLILRRRRALLRAGVAAGLTAAAVAAALTRPLVASAPMEADAGVLHLAAKSSARGGLYVHPIIGWNTMSGVRMIETAHRLGRPIVNGCLGICPPWFTYATRVLRRFPDPEALWLLRAWKVQTVVGVQGGLPTVPDGVVKLFTNDAGQFVCDVLPVGDAAPHPSSGGALLPGQTRVEGSWMGEKQGPGSRAAVSVPARFLVEAVEIRFLPSVVHLVPPRLDVFETSGGPRVRLNEGRSGEWLESLAADALLRRQPPAATIRLAIHGAPAARRLEFDFPDSPEPPLERVTLLGRWQQ